MANVSYNRCMNWYYVTAAGIILVALVVVAVVYLVAGSQNVALQRAALGVLDTCTTLALGLVVVARVQGKKPNS